MAGGPLGGLLADGSIGRQLLVWGVLNSVLSQALEPVMTQINDELWPLLPSQPLSAADCAEMLLKGIMTQAEAEEEGKRTGVSAGRMHQLWRNAGEPISPRDALEALRRGLVPDDAGPGGGPSFMEAVRQSRLRDEWGPVLRDMQWVPIPVADAVDAVVEGQITHDEGAHYAQINGVKPDEFQILVNTRGRPPSPTELAELMRRGFIAREGTGPDATTFQQGIFEGATKNKWWTLFAHLADYLPPPRTITALLHEGAITNDQAARLFKEAGLSDELAHAYVVSASHQKLAKARELQLSTVLDLYEGHAITAAEATVDIEHLGYTAQEVAYLLRVRDIQRTLKAVNAAITRVGSLYIARKIDAKSARSGLTAVGIDAAQQDELVAVWDLERQRTVRVLTPAQIASAVYYQVITFDVGVQKLVADGYTEDDAKILIDVRLHGVPSTPLPAPK